MGGGWLGHMLGLGKAYCDVLPVFVHFVQNSLSLPLSLSFIFSTVLFIY